MQVRLSILNKIRSALILNHINWLKLPNSGSDVGNNGSISKTQKYVLSGNSNLFNPNQKIGNSSIFQSMSKRFKAAFSSVHPSDAQPSPSSFKTLFTLYRIVK